MGLRQVAPDGTDRLSRHRVKASTRRASDARDVRDRRFDAPEIRDHIRSLFDAPIDVLFIDGDHTYAGVRQDWLMYRSLCARGALVAFHDIAPQVPENPEIGVPCSLG